MLLGAAMDMTGMGADHPSLKLRTMSDEELWWTFLQQRKEWSQWLHEFHEEVDARKVAGTLSPSSPLWAMEAVPSFFPTLPEDNNNLIELTSQEWEARRRRKIVRPISA